MSQNYMMLDLRGTLLATVLLAIFFFPPGYILGWATDVLQFRRRSVRERFLLSLPLSLVASTVLANIVGRFAAPSVVLATFLVLAIAALLALGIRWRRGRERLTFSMPMKICVGMAMVWAAVVMGSVVDLQMGQRLYPSTTIWDHGVRIAFIHSALRTGVPPVNPFAYLAQHAPVARYYYYWNVLCSYPVRLAHIDARYVLYASSIWSGFCLAALIPIYLKNFSGVREHLERRSTLAILLLAVTGFDILPNLYERFRGHMVYPDMEWWDPVQVTAWHDALIWVPHHVAALVAFFIGFLALWSVRQNDAGAAVRGWKERVMAGVFAACAFAAGAGLSVYVAFTFALFLAVWGMRLLLRRKWRDVVLYGIAGCLTILISIPYLHDLLPAAYGAGSAGPAAASGSSTSFVAFGIRTLPNFLSTPFFLQQHGFNHPALLIPFGVVMVYLLEFGFFALVGWNRAWRDVRERRTLRESEIAGWYLLAIGMLVITFLRSAVIANNDLAYRSAMIVQFVLLLWGAEYLDTWLFESKDGRAAGFRLKDAVIAASLLLGMASTLYSLVVLRGYTILDDRGAIPDPAAWLPEPHHLGEKMYGVRTAYEQLKKSLPPTSIVQYNPMATDFLPFLMYDSFQSVDAFPDCGSTFGGSRAACLPVQEELAQLFTSGSTQEMQRVCRDLSIDVLVAQSTDGAWQDRTSWVWSSTPMAENNFVRAVRCR